MSKCLYVISRHGKNNDDFRDDFQSICERISPEDINPKAAFISANKGTHIGIFNPTRSFYVKNESFYLGNILDEKDNWYQVRTSKPEGTYALFRTGTNCVEVISDILASRTIWYYLTDDFFIASTSQRMIISYLGNYEFNEKVYPWLLKTGTLGPGISWDKRLEPLPPDSVLTLDRDSWKISVETTEVNIISKASKKKTNRNSKNFKHQIESTFQNLKLDFEKWLLPLSGGYDSRALLLFLIKKRELRTITWGVKKSLLEPNSDAYIAKMVAENYGINNQYFTTDFEEEYEIEMIIDKFLKNGEGRIDHIVGYLDGFSLWKQLFDSGVEGIIRGDEAFGWVFVRTERDVLDSLGIKLSNNLRSIFKEMENEEFLKKPTNLSLEQWRDHLYQTFRVPYVLAALNDLKSSYVEIINPFLSHNIIEATRNLPDNQRTNKRAFKTLVNQKDTSDIGYAKFSSNNSLADIVNQREFLDVILNEVTTSQRLPKVLIHEIQENLKNPPDRAEKRKSLNSKLRQILPSKLKSFLKIFIVRDNKVNYEMIGYRAMIISKMDSILANDASTLSKRRRK